MKNNLILGSLLLWIFTGCSITENKQQEISLPEVEVVEIEEVKAFDQINTTGLVKAAKTLRLSFKIGGIIDQIHVAEGESVRSGQVLAKLKTREIDAKVNQAELAVDKAKRDFNRADNLFKDSVATREQWQNAKTALEAAKADLRVAKFNQKHAVIKASHNSIVLKKLAEKGEITDAGYPVIVLGSNETTHIIKASVTDKEWVMLNTGDSAQIMMDAYEDQVFHASISQISAMADPYTGTYDVELTFTSEPRKIATGMLTTVTIFPQNTKTYLRIPVDALIEADGNTGWVSIVKDNKVERRKIQIKQIENKYLYLKGDVIQGEEVITEGKSYVSVGQQVKKIKK